MPWLLNSKRVFVVKRLIVIKVKNPMKYVAAEGQFCGATRIWGAAGEYKAFNIIKDRRMMKIGGK